MADLSTCPPINRSSVQTAHKRIEEYIHRTPTVTCETLNQIASTPKSERCPSTGVNVAAEPAPHTNNVRGTAASSNANPKVRLFFKCENQQKIGAFKARGAFHALGRLIEEKGIETVREKGVVTHSSGTVSSFLSKLPTRLTTICRKPRTSSGISCQNTWRTRTHCNADHLYALKDRRHKITWCQCHLLRVY
jgi:threonine dehydratase